MWAISGDPDQTLHSAAFDLGLHLLPMFHKKDTRLKLVKFLSGTLSECQRVWIQIRTDVLSVLIWIQTVCKGYQQVTKFAASNLNDCLTYLHASEVLLEDAMLKYSSSSSSFICFNSLATMKQYFCLI